MTEGKERNEGLPADRAAMLAGILRSIGDNVAAALRLLEATGEGARVSESSPPGGPLPAPAAGGSAVEGVFDGKAMIGPDGKEYPIPPNYASKSKLVEGDMLKLVIAPTGAFIFKQIGPIERERMIGTLVHDRETDEYSVVAGEKKYRVLKASITYFRGADGDETVILVPKGAPSRWAAVENVIKKA